MCGLMSATSILLNMRPKTMPVLYGMDHKPSKTETFFNKTGLSFPYIDTLLCYGEILLSITFLGWIFELILRCTTQKVTFSSKELNILRDSLETEAKETKPAEEEPQEECWDQQVQVVVHPPAGHTADQKKSKQEVEQQKITETRVDSSSVTYLDKEREQTDNDTEKDSLLARLSDDSTKRQQDIKDIAFSKIQKDNTKEDRDLDNAVVRNKLSCEELISTETDIPQTKKDYRNLPSDAYSKSVPPRPPVSKDQSVLVQPTTTTTIINTENVPAQLIPVSEPDPDLVPTTIPTPLRNALMNVPVLELLEIVKRKIQRGINDVTILQSKPASNMDLLLEKYCSADILSIKQDIAADKSYSVSPSRSENPVCRSSSGSLCPACVVSPHQQSSRQSPVCINKEPPSISSEQINVAKVASIIVTEAMDAALNAFEKNTEFIHQDRKALVDKLHSKVSNTVLSTSVSSVINKQAEQGRKSSVSSSGKDVSLGHVASDNLIEAIRDSVAQCLTTVSQTLIVEEDTTKDTTKTSSSGLRTSSEPKIQSEHQDNVLTKVETQFKRDLPLESAHQISDTGIKPLASLKSLKSISKDQENEKNEQPITEESIVPLKSEISSVSPQNLPGQLPTDRRSSAVGKLYGKFLRKFSLTPKSGGNQIISATKQDAHELNKEKKQIESKIETSNESLLDISNTERELNRSLEIIRRYSQKRLDTTSEGSGKAVVVLADIHADSSEKYPEAAGQETIVSGRENTDTQPVKKDGHDAPLDSQKVVSVANVEGIAEDEEETEETTLLNKHICDHDIFPYKMEDKIRKKIVRMTVSEAMNLAASEIKDMKTHTRAMHKLLNAVKKNEFRNYIYDNIMDTAVAELVNEQKVNGIEAKCLCGYKYQIGWFIVGRDPVVKANPDLEIHNIPMKSIDYAVSEGIETVAEDILDIVLRSKRSILGAPAISSQEELTSTSSRHVAAKVMLEVMSNKQKITIT